MRAACIELFALSNEQVAVTWQSCFACRSLVYHFQSGRFASNDAMNKLNLNPNLSSIPSSNSHLKNQIKLQFRFQVNWSRGIREKQGNYDS